MENFEIVGGKKLKGEVIINSSKNAAVAVLLGSLINRGKTTLRNVPQIEEVNRLLEVLESIGVKFEKKGRNIVVIPPKKLDIEKIDRQAAERTRSIILIIGALAGRLKKYSVPQSGGCRLGSRTVRPHLFALENLGIKIRVGPKGFVVESRDLKPGQKIVLYEAGDTATENAILAAAQIPGKTTIKLASANYMVQDVCFFLEKMGVKIKGIGSMTLEIEGVKEINKDIEYEISEDPIEAMFFLSLAATTNSQLLIKRCPIDFLELELLKLEKMGFKYKAGKEYLSRNGKTKLVDIETYPSKLTALEEKIHPAAPSSAGINIDNLPFFVPVATQAKGRTLIHDWVYENRAIYFSELNKLGANVTLLDAHRVYIDGPGKLKGTDMMCPPALRPAAIILVAMLAASGKSTLRNVYSINRGYEKLEDRLGKLGAEIMLIRV
ncbi:MAG: UDP-N-acetylglucosamine 1-carboxyvinyltransferase [Candidatus Moranbacteria bacterium RIFOXYA12_FULL_44_15]|nr:MAG: UDP-N-acetylglucosamine 1-carboxyvinyltransferase [Candidatus Moranbacteria bacterium RIFOXYA12_FULL_44_15]OGI35478.1 MAG: UDP-N-acetylglucosamine 1-carboxyvinyltransferase [Candidatus Moranbacteria bacterium RIFOXYA2_FULL_43_15]